MVFPIITQTKTLVFLIYKSILSLLPSYLLTYTVQKNLGSHDLLKQEGSGLNLGKNSFQVCCSLFLEQPVKYTNLDEMGSLDILKQIWDDLEADASVCRFISGVSSEVLNSGSRYCLNLF